MSVHTDGRLVATFPLNGSPSLATRVYIEEEGMEVGPGQVLDQDRFVVVTERGELVGYRGGSWFPTMESAVARALSNNGWGSTVEDALRVAHEQEVRS